MLKEYKYYAIHIDKMVVIRRTLKGLKLVLSKLYKPEAGYTITQQTYTGGIVIGTMKYTDWYKYQKQSIPAQKALKTTREVVVALAPYITRSKRLEQEN